MINSLVMHFFIHNDDDDNDYHEDDDKTLACDNTVILYCNGGKINKLK